MANNFSVIGVTDVIKIKKLPPKWRKANTIYKIILIALVFFHTIITTINAHYDNDIIPTLYFELYSVVMSGFPVAWSYILDEVKVLHEMKTPTGTPQSSMDTEFNTTISKTTKRRLNRSKSLCGRDELPEDEINDITEEWNKFKMLCRISEESSSSLNSPTSESASDRNDSPIDTCDESSTEVT